MGDSSSDVLNFDYYALLKVGRAASPAEIREAVRTERVRWSNRIPKGGAVGERARKVAERISEAERVLLDSTARARYDQELAVGERRPQASPVREETDWPTVILGYVDSGDWPMVEAAIERARAEQPRNPAVWEAIAAAYIREDNLSKADEAAQQLLLVDPSSPNGYTIRADVKYNQGNYSSAIDFYRVAAKLAAARDSIDWSKRLEDMVCVSKAEALLADVPNEERVTPSLDYWSRMKLDVMKLYKGASMTNSFAVTRMSEELGLCDQKSAAARTRMEVERKAKTAKEEAVQKKRLAETETKRKLEAEASRAHLVNLAVLICWLFLGFFMRSGVGNGNPVGAISALIFFFPTLLLLTTLIRAKSTPHSLAGDGFLWLHIAGAAIYIAALSIH